MLGLKNMTLTTLAAALLGAMLALLPADAFAGHLYGSNAWTNAPGPLYGGPGPVYGQVGQVDGQIRISVDRCTGQWCQIRAGSQSGWHPLSNLDFGQAPGNASIRFNQLGGGPGYVCFYSKANFAGTEYCAAPGTHVRDLKLYGRDNAVGSIKIVGNASATVCRDFDLTSYCSRIVLSKPYMPDELRDAVSSFRVH